MREGAAHYYGHVHSSGGAKGGRASGVPFAAVETDEPSDVSTCAEPTGYRFFAHYHPHNGGKTAFRTPCPRAAYCWAPGALNSTRHAHGPYNRRDLTLLDLMAEGGEFIVGALLRLSRHIDKKFEICDLNGSFDGIALRTHRTPKQVKSAWSRRKEVTRQLEDVLRKGPAGARVTVTPGTFLLWEDAITTEAGKFHDFILKQPLSPVPRVRPQQFKNAPFDMNQVRSIVFRQLHANVWDAVRSASASACQAGFIAPEKQASIYIIAPEKLKQCSQRSSKCRLVWVCPAANLPRAITLASEGAFEEVRAMGRTTLVLSESMAHASALSSPCPLPARSSSSS